MSSPLSSLKKTKRSPLQSPTKPTVGVTPFRHPDFTDDQIQHLTENTSVRLIKNYKPYRRPDRQSSLFQAVSTTNKNLLNAPNSGIQEEKNSTNKPPTDQELMSLLMTRLVHLETQLSESQKMLFEKDKVINTLEEKIRILEKTRGSSVTSGMIELEERCLKLQQQIHEMEKFLSDYGMVWVGEKRASTASLSTVSGDIDSFEIFEEGSNIKLESMWRPDESVVPERELVIDYDVILENIKELNHFAGEGIAQVEVSSGGGRLKEVDPIPLTLYSNGLMIFSGPFRPFSDPSTKQCVQDLMDGFYPTELQSMYPDGVPFKVIDRRNVTFRDNQVPFSGEGLHLLKDISSVSKDKEKLRVTNEILKYTSTNCKEERSTIKRQQFLQKLPRSVVRAGKLINIRDAVAEVLQIVPQEAEFKEIPTTEDKDLNSNSTGKPVTLRLKSETGSETYLLKLKSTDTIGDIKKYVDKYRFKKLRFLIDIVIFGQNKSLPSPVNLGDFDSNLVKEESLPDLQFISWQLCRPSVQGDYQIVTLCPFKRFDKFDATLEESGLTPNAALYLRPVLSKSSQDSTENNVC